MRKVIRSEATEFRYERGEQPLPRIGPWRDQLGGLLLANEGKPARCAMAPRSKTGCCRPAWSGCGVS